MYHAAVKERVRITDVSPRDGLQNEPGIIPTADKVRLIELLCATGVDEIEVTSFVSPKWVPQLGDAADVVRGLLSLPLQEGGWGVGSAAWPPPGGRGLRKPILLSALVPNDQGLQAALNANRSAQRSLVGKISVFTAASETFSQKNTNASIAGTIERFKPVIARAHAEGLPVRAYLSCVIACPFEGTLGPEKVVSVCRQLSDLGVDELDLGDTIGAGTPETIAALLRDLDRQVPIRGGRVPITLHLHDTFGRAAECVKAALDLGIRSFDGSVAGLGGCPYASKKLPDGTIQRAPGNISTELLVRTIHDAGYETSVDPSKLDFAGDFAREIVAKSRRAPPPGASA